MKKIKYILPILTLFLSVNVFSQKKRTIHREDKIKSYKIAYITEQLDLTEKEAEKFWVVYKVYEEKLAQLRKKERHSIHKLINNSNNIDDLSEAESKKIMTSIISVKNKTLSVHQEYYRKLKNILSYKKILKLQVAEHKFKKILFERLKRRRKPRK